MSKKNTKRKSDIDIKTWLVGAITDLIIKIALLLIQMLPD